MSRAPFTDTWPLRTDRIHRWLYRDGFSIRLPRKDVWDETIDGNWCIYGCPTQPSEFVDHGDVRILWGTCQHPIDLTTGSAHRHLVSYPERVRRQWEGWQCGSPSSITHGSVTRSLHLTPSTTASVSRSPSARTWAARTVARLSRLRRSRTARR